MSDRAFCDQHVLHPPHNYRAVNGNHYNCSGWDEVDEALAQQREAQPPCEHGLSAWLCVGPSHYPMEDERD